MCTLLSVAVNINLCEYHPRNVVQYFGFTGDVLSAQQRTSLFFNTSKISKGARIVLVLLPCFRTEKGLLVDLSFLKPLRHSYNTQNKFTFENYE